jgi:hypothetical protein
MKLAEEFTKKYSFVVFKNIIQTVIVSKLIGISTLRQTQDRPSQAQCEREF